MFNFVLENVMNLDLIVSFVHFFVFNFLIQEEGCSQEIFFFANVVGQIAAISH